MATGAPGAIGNGGDTAGRGARVSADLAVSPGQRLYVNAGGASTGSGECGDGVACKGGFNGGGSSRDGGGGGGASDVRLVPSDQDISLPSRLIVAAGGGGSGQGEGDLDGFFGHSGTSGSLGQGGASAAGGGAGGGGLFGGGGGAQIGLPEDPVFTSTSGGGGGGSNLVPDGGTATLDDGGDPSVAISYELGGISEPPPPAPDDKQACKKGGHEALGFKNQGQCIRAVIARN